MPTLYTAADIMKALPTLERLRSKSFRELKAMYRAAGGPAKGHHISKRDCIMFIAFGIGPTESSELAKAEGTINELTLQLKAANAGVAARTKERDTACKSGEEYQRERDFARQERDQLLGTFRQLMNL